MRQDSRVRRRLKLRDLDTLVAIAQHGSMAKAAAHLSVSQPAISKAIVEMEHTLGVRLLDRTAQGVEPNLSGRALLKWATAVFDDVKQGVTEIEALADPTGGQLRVGANDPFIVGPLPAILEQLHGKYPRVCVHVELAATTTDRANGLRERNFDLCLGRIPKPNDDDINSEIMFHDRLFVVAGLNNRWTHRRKISLAELINETWMLPPPDMVIGSMVAEAFRASGLDVPWSNVITLSIPLYGALLARGRYLAFCPASMLWFSGKRLGLKVLPVELPGPPWPVAITTLKNRTISPVAGPFHRVHARGHQAVSEESMDRPRKQVFIVSNRYQAACSSYPCAGRQPQLTLSL